MKNKDIFLPCSYVNKIYFFETKNILSAILSLPCLLILLRKRNFDILFDLHQWPYVTALISYLTGAKERIGFIGDRKGRDLLYTKKVKHIKSKYETLCFLDLLYPLGICAPKFELKIWLNEKDKKYATDFFKRHNIDGNFIVGIHPGAAYPQKRWSVDNFVRLINELNREYNAKIIVFVGPKECEVLDEILVKTIKKPITVVNATIGRLSALISKCNLFITNDNGVMHIAAALKVPLIALFGMTDPGKWGPKGENCELIYKNLSCSPCVYLGFLPKCKKNTCMELITVDEVMSAVRKLTGNLQILRKVG